MGPETRAFERVFADHFGARHAVMANSGSSANLLAIAALFYRKERPLQRGDVVIVPAVSWATTYTPLQQYGLRLRFVDVDRDTFNYDLDALAAAMRDDVRLLVVVNLLGNPNRFDVIEGLARDRGIAIIEDNCEAMGARFGGRSAGAFGLAGTFSTFFSHHIATGEGGVVITDDEELHQIMVSLRAHGWTRDLPTDNLVTGRKNPDPFEESYHFVLPGYNLRPTELAAAVGLEQIAKLDGFVEVRRRNARVFEALFRDHPLVSIQREVGESSWFGFGMVLRDGVRPSRKEVVDHLQANGVECRPIVAGNFARHPVLRFFDCESLPPLPNAEALDRRGLFVGNHHYGIEDEIRGLREALDECIGT